MAGDFALAEAFVRIRPDATGFRADTEKAIKTALAGIKPEVKVKVNIDTAGLTAATVAAVKAAAAAAGNIKIPVKMEVSVDPAEIGRQIAVIKQRMIQGGLADFLDYNLPIGRIQYQIGLMRRLLQQGKLTDFLATSLQPGQVLQQGAALRDALQHELGAVGIGTNLNAADLSREAVAARAALVAALGKVTVPVTETVTGSPPGPRTITEISALASAYLDARNAAYAYNDAINASQEDTARLLNEMMDLTASLGQQGLADDLDKAHAAAIQYNQAIFNSAEDTAYLHNEMLDLTGALKKQNDAAAAVIPLFKAGAGATGAWNSRLQLFGGLLTGFGIPAIIGTAGGIHFLTDAIIETISVLVPATLAFVAFGAAAVPTVQTIYQKMQAVYTTSKALNQSIYPLTGQFNNLANAAQPKVIELFGEGLYVINQNSGKLIPVIQKVGSVLDTLGARAAVALTSGGIGTFLKNGPKDIAGIGSIIGNIFGTIGNFLHVVPGYAQDLLHVLDDVTQGIEHVTASPITQWVLGLGLAFHGALLYAGLAATAFVFLGNALVGLAIKFGLAGEGAMFFNSALFGAGIKQMVTNIGILIGGFFGLGAAEDTAAAGALALEGAWGALEAIAPVLIVTAIAAAIYFFVKAISSATSATQAYDDAVNNAIATAPVTQEGIQMTLAMKDATQQAAEAQQQLGRTQEYVNTVNTHTGLSIRSVSSEYLHQAAIVAGYKGEIATIVGFQKNYNQALRAAGGNTAFFTGTSISLGDAITKGGETLKQFIVEVQANADAQKALALGIGRSAAAQNAQTNEWMTSGLPAMQKVITAEDAITTMILSGEQAFTAYDTSLQQLGTDLGKNADQLLGFNKAGLTVSSDIFSSVLPAFQKTIDAAQGMNVSTADLTKIIATEGKQFLILAGNNDTARAALVGMINNALGPGTVSYKTLNSWLKTNSTSQQGLNQLWSNATVAAGTLAGVIQTQLTAQFIALSLKESGAAQAAVDFKNSILRTGDASQATAAARQTLINDLINAGLSAKQARQYVQNLQAQIDAMHGKTVPVSVQAYASGAVHINSNVPGGQPYSIFFHAAKGAVIPGYGGGDKYPVLVEGGEVIAPKQAGKAVMALLKVMGIPGFQGGGLVGVPGTAGSDTGVDSALAVLADTKDATGAYRKLEQAALVGILAGAGPYSPGLITVARYVMTHGGTAASAAGVGGVIAGESGGNPEILQIGGGGGAGLLQWTPASSAFPIQPIITGNVNRDMGVQLVDMMAYIGSRGGIGVLNNAGAISPMLAAWYFSAMEAPAVPGSDIRPDVVAALYAQGLDNGGWIPTGWSAVHNGTGSPEWVPPPAARAHRAGTHAPKITLEIRSGSSSDFDKFMTVWMQKSVFVRGGGSVQSAWGSG